jgi:hypothetical protein
MMDRIIVMGDIQQSRTFDGEELIRRFKALITSCNQHLARGIASPYTITLGDEFQGITDSLRWAVESILYLDETILREHLDFAMRYVVHIGAIVTPVNHARAYEMLGPGLTHARELLSDKRRGRAQFIFDLPNRQLGTHLGRVFDVMASIRSSWSNKDIALIFDMLASDNNAAIGFRHGKNRSQIWKRRRSLHISDYAALRMMAIELTEGG